MFKKPHYTFEVRTLSAFGKPICIGLHGRSHTMPCPFQQLTTDQKRVFFLADLTAQGIFKQLRCEPSHKYAIKFVATVKHHAISMCPAAKLWRSNKSFC